VEHVREVIIVEGRYDKNAVLQAVDAAVIETNGFGIFSDAEKLALIRRLAQARGAVILTDGDSAGFLIRGHLKGALPKERVLHAYVPDVYGKEKRKSAPSKEGKLGVEGVGSKAILAALRRAGATFEEAEQTKTGAPPITKADLFALGLSGCEGSREKRLALQRRLGLPERLPPNSLLDVLNALYARDDFLAQAARTEEEQT